MICLINNNYTHSKNIRHASKFILCKKNLNCKKMGSRKVLALSLVIFLHAATENDRGKEAVQGREKF